MHAWTNHYTDVKPQRKSLYVCPKRFSVNRSGPRRFSSSRHAPHANKSPSALRDTETTPHTTVWCIQLL